ncbi:MAG TPA: hypothetical protein PK239_02000 [Chitinophagales bacterium]|nr:hypothetical protein [Chitinophagales bacterium]
MLTKSLPNFIGLCFLLFTFLPKKANAQPSGAPKLAPYSSSFYLNLGGGGGTGGSLGVGLNYVSAKNTGFEVSYRFFTPRAKNMPSDYQPGLCIFGNCQPDDYAHFINTMFKFHKALNAKPVRYELSAGPGLLLYNEAHFTPQNGGWFGSNYHIYREMKLSAGLSVRGALSVWLLKRFGIEIAVFTNLNPMRSVVGAEVYLLLGRLRR